MLFLIILTSNVIFSVLKGDNWGRHKARIGQERGGELA